jgi:hypothetical protein
MPLQNAERINAGSSGLARAAEKTGSDVPCSLAVRALQHRAPRIIIPVAHMPRDLAKNNDLIALEELAHLLLELDLQY